jgi:hypothetical protein
MDPITTAIVATLTSGFDDDATAVERKAKIEAYEALIAVLEKKFGLQSEIVNAIEGLEAKPDSTGRKEVLKEECDWKQNVAGCVAFCFTRVPATFCFHFLIGSRTGFRCPTRA